MGGRSVQPPQAPFGFGPGARSPEPYAMSAEELAAQEQAQQEKRVLNMINRVQMLQIAC